MGIFLMSIILFFSVASFIFGLFFISDLRITDIEDIVLVRKRIRIFHEKRFIILPSVIGTYRSVCNLANLGNPVTNIGNFAFQYRSAFGIK